MWTPNLDASLGSPDVWLACGGDSRVFGRVLAGERQRVV